MPTQRPERKTQAVTYTGKQFETRTSVTILRRKFPFPVSH